MFAAGSERSSGAPAQPERPPPPLPPPRFPNSGVWQWETAPLNIGNLVIMNTSIPLPLLFTTNSLTLENQLYEIITERSKACAAFLRNSLRRAVNATTTIGWSVTENFESNVSCNHAWSDGRRDWKRRSPVDCITGYRIEREVARECFPARNLNEPA